MILNGAAIEELPNLPMDRIVRISTPQGRTLLRAAENISCTKELYTTQQWKNGSRRQLRELAHDLDARIIKLY